MKKYKSSDYLFLSGYIKTKEKYLLTIDKVEKMIESKTPDDALKVLYELDYGLTNDEIPAKQFEVLLSRELEKTYNYIRSLAPDPEYFDVFLYRYDYHNVKGLMKAEFLGVPSEGKLINMGTIPQEELAEMITERKYSDMSNEMAEGIKEVIEKYGLTKDPQVISMILDKACYKDINARMSGFKNDYIKKYMAVKIDTINLKSFIRVRAMNKPWKFYNEAYIEGGNMPKRILEENYAEPNEAIVEKMVSRGMKKLLHDGSIISEEIGSFAIFEKLCDNLLMDFIKETKGIAYGIQPITNYIVAKESEIKTARIIMTGKLASIPPSIIRERIRTTYV